MTGERSPSTFGRRAVLAAAAAAGTGGCVGRVESVLSRSAPSQLSLSIKTLPADDDPRATRIARFFATRLGQVGVDATVVPLTYEELWRDVLLNHDFDVYVGRFPERRDPDFLRTLLHSKFGTETGWQNPFGYANLAVDDVLVTQRRQSGRRRLQTVRQLQRAIARDQPFTVVAFPDEFRAARSDRFVEWGDDRIHSVPGYLSLRRAGLEGGTLTDAATPTADEDDADLRMTITDVRPTRNLNPLAVEFRDSGVITGLLYDPLARRVGGQFRPWLAESWTWTGLEADARESAVDAPAETPTAPTSARSSTAESDAGPTCELTLRSDLRWHDGEPLTAADVAFTYRFLADTSLGSLSTPVPAPCFRGPVSLVEDVEVRTPRRLRVGFVASQPSVAVSALTVPILPEHVWTERTEQATIAGIDTESPVTEALVRPNMTPVGSGPLRVRNAAADRSLTLEPFDEHFLARSPEGIPARYAGPPAFRHLRFQVVPSAAAAVELLRDGQADATATGVGPEDIPTIGRSEAVSLYANRSRSFYHVGYNLRTAPFASPRFRRAIARLFDKQYLVDEVFGGYANPAASPLSGTRWLAPALEWFDEDPELPFPGSDGRLDVERAKQVFIDAGYRYTDDGRLVTG